MFSASRPRSTLPAPCVTVALATLALALLGACRKPAPSVAPGAPARRPSPAAPSIPARGAASLVGQVVDGAGHAVPGAHLLLWSRAAETPAAPLQAIADAGGRFSFAEAGSGPYELFAEAPGFPPLRLAAPAPGAPLIVRLDGVARSIGGAVLDGGTPVAGATVILDGETIEPQRLSETGRDGRFAFGGLGPGAYSVRAIRGARASPPSAEIVLSRAGPGPAPVRLALQAGFPLGGRVVGAEGPLSASEVRIVSSPARSPSEPAVVDVAHADGAGVWASRALPPGEYRLTARRPGFVPRQIVTIVVSAADARRTVTLELVRAAGITGRIVDGQARAIRGAIVRCLAPGSRDLAVITDPLPSAAEAAAVPASSGRAVTTARTALSDEAGRFEIADLVPAKVRLDVSAAGHVPWRGDEIALRPGETRAVGDLVLADGVALGGRVVDQFRSPLEGARVAAADGPFTLTDGAGQWTLSLAPGPHTLAITAPGMRDQQIAVAPTAAGGSPAPLEIVLDRADAWLEGIVQDSGGRPVARALIAAWPAAADQADPVRIADGAAVLATTVADTGGHFRLAQLPNRPLILEVRQPAYPSARAPAVPGTFAAVVVPIPGALAGDVHDARSGAALARFRVEARGPEGRTASASPRKGGAGAFVLSALAPGPWTLVVDAPGYEPGEITVDVPASPTLGEPSVRDRRVDLQPLR
ncbi:MAG TPA: carboxypeptidase-like regulatory domain-containing protein [Polyangia bacterium]|nr:carboxypeptidase-like regulatory domain-containing protein [Polyangia bacterium]